VAESGILLRCCTGKTGTEGSNPSLSAKPGMPGFFMGY